MDKMMDKKTTDNSIDSPSQMNDAETRQENEGNSPLDDIIAKVESYIFNPKLVNPQTLTDLKSDLEDLKSFFDEEETPIGEKRDSSDNGHGLMIMIGNAAKKKMGGMG